MGDRMVGAVEARFAASDRIIISFIGDFGFLMNGTEVSTEFAYKTGNLCCYE